MQKADEISPGQSGVNCAEQILPLAAIGHCIPVCRLFDFHPFATMYHKFAIPGSADA
jgi:hypothetical protein